MSAPLQVYFAWAVVCLVRLAGELVSGRVTRGLTGLFCCYCCRDDRHEDFRIRAGFEGHFAFNKGENGMVDAHADAGARMPLGSALADDDVARNRSLAAKLLDAKTTTSGVTTVAG